MGNAFKKESGQVSSPITPVEGVRLDIWRNIDNLITQLEPGVKELTLKQSLLHKAAVGLEKSAEGSVGPKFFGLGLPTSLVQGGVDKVSQGLQGIGGAAQNIPQNLPAITTPAILNSMPKTAPQSPGLPPITAGGNMGGQDNVVMPEISGAAPTEPTTNYITKHSPEEIYGAMQKAQRAGDKGAVAALRQMYTDETGYQSTHGGTDATTQKRVQALNRVSGVVDRIAEEAMSAPEGVGGASQALLGKLPGYEGGDAEYLERDTAGFARLVASALAGEVGVATDKDVERWMGLMPKAGDTINERRNRMQKLINQIELESNAYNVNLNLDKVKKIVNPNGLPPIL